MTKKKSELPPFAVRLRELRDKAKMTQKELAAKAGMHLAGVFKLEQGTNQPTWATIEALAKALGVECVAFKGTSACVGCPKSPPEPPAPKKRGRKR